MRLRLLVLLLLVVLAGCGGGSDEVPADAVAVVDGTEIKRSDYDAVLTQAKKSYKNQKREFPAAGSQEFQTLRNQAVQFLVQREQFEQKAEDLDIEVTDKQVEFVAEPSAAASASSSRVLSTSTASRPASRTRFLHVLWRIVESQALRFVPRSNLSESGTP